MKKYVLVLSCLLVVVLASAFTIAQKNAKTTDTYYFYEVDQNNAINPSVKLNSIPMTLEAFLENNPVDCPEGTEADCVRAFLPSSTPTAHGNPDEVIQKDIP